MSRAPDANHLVLWTSQWKSAIEPGTCKNTMTLTILSWDGTKEVMGSGWVQEFGGPESILGMRHLSLKDWLAEVQKGTATLANLIHPHYAVGVGRLKNSTYSQESLFKKFETSHQQKVKSKEQAIMFVGNRSHRSQMEDLVPTHFLSKEPLHTNQIYICVCVWVYCLTHFVWYFWTLMTCSICFHLWSELRIQYH